MLGRDYSRARAMGAARLRIVRNRGRWAVCRAVRRGASAAIAGAGTGLCAGCSRPRARIGRGRGRRRARLGVRTVRVHARGELRPAGERAFGAGGRAPGDSKGRDDQVTRVRHGLVGAPSVGGGRGGVPPLPRAEHMLRRHGTDAAGCLLARCVGSSRCVQSRDSKSMRGSTSV